MSIFLWVATAGLVAVWALPDGDLLGELVRFWSALLIAFFAIACFSMDSFSSWAAISFYLWALFSAAICEEDFCVCSVACTAYVGAVLTRETLGIDFCFYSACAPFCMSFKVDDPPALPGRFALLERFLSARATACSVSRIIFSFLTSSFWSRTARFCLRSLAFSSATY